MEQLALKRKREVQLFTPLKRMPVYRPLESLAPESLTPTSHRESTRAICSLMIAAQQGSTAHVRYHLETRSPSLAHERYGPHNRTLLHLAARSDSLPLLTYLRIVHKVDLHALDNSGLSALEYARSEEAISFLRRESRWEARKGVLFCYCNGMRLLNQLPLQLIRALLEDGFC